MSEEDRIRWHCRRGLLELDLILQKFLDSRFTTLSSSQRVAFAGLLAREDGELWALICGDVRPSGKEEAAVLELLQGDNPST